MPVRDEGTFDMSDTSDNVQQAPPKVTTQWQLKRSFSFHKCIDTDKTIWPFTKAYSKLTYHYKPSPKDGQTVVVWVSQEAYTFRKLTSNS